MELAPSTRLVSPRQILDPPLYYAGICIYSNKLPMDTICKFKIPQETVTADQ